MIALGGCSNSGYLDGHEYVYEGSKYGKSRYINSNTTKLFDELDKVSDTAR